MRPDQRKRPTTKASSAVRIAVSLLLLATTTVVLRPEVLSAAESKAEVTKTIQSTIEMRFPGTKVIDVQPSAMPGLYEIYLGDQIVYTDASADYLVMGPLVDTQTKENLTENRLNERGKVDFHTLPFDRAIKIVKGNGSRSFAVFSDPDCPFCQQLEQSLLSVTNVTMYVFLFPIAGLHPQAPQKAHAIWCAPNRADAWNQWMHAKKLPPAGTCKGDPVDYLQNLGAQLHVDSTPTLFFSDGRRVAGSIPPQEIEKLLNAAAGAAVAPAKGAAPTTPTTAAPATNVSAPNASAPTASTPPKPAASPPAAAQPPQSK